MCSRPFRPVGLPIYVARVPAAPFHRRDPCGFAFYVTHPIRSIPEFLNSPLVSGRALADSKKGDPLVRIRPRTQTVFQLALTGMRR